MARRGWLLVLAFCLAVTDALAARQNTGCASLKEIAPGVYRRAGTGGEPTPSNRGETRHAFALLAPAGWLVIDPGPSVKSGRALACGLARRDRRPILALINTHPHPENVLANAAFPTVPVFAASSAASAMATRCDSCLANLSRQVGEQTLAGTVPRIPDRPIEQAQEISLGGRRLLLLPLGKAHSPGDLAVLDFASASLLLGDAGDPNALPDLRDGELTAAIAAYEQLREVAAEHGVSRLLGGQGRSRQPAELAPPLAYLHELQRRAEAAVRNGDPVFQPPLAGTHRPAERRRHQLNAQQAYRAAEARWWDEVPPVSPSP